MPYTISQNDIVQVTVVTHLPDIVKCLNVLHYRYTDPNALPDGHAAVEELASAVGNPGLTGSFAARWKELASDQAVIEEIWGQKVYPVRYGKVVVNTNTVGVLVTEPLPGLNQFNISKRGDIAARYAVGGVRIAGLAEDMEAKSQLTAGGIILAENLAEAIAAEVVTVSAHHWKPIVYRRGNPGSSVDVVEVKVNPIISSQRSRIAFRGI